VCVFRRKGGNLPPLSFTEMGRHRPGGPLNSLAKAVTSDPGSPEAPFLERMGSWRDEAGFPRRDHASRWAAITSIVEKLGCAAEMLRSWVRQAECDGVGDPG
jgi:hypothetical protein